MITEDYISFETAKLLKEKGFMDGAIVKFFASGYNKNGHILSIRDTELDDYPRPTLQMAMKWLREKHILIIHDVENFYMDGSVASWIYHIWCADNIEESHSAHFKTYEESCEAAIKYCLENLV